MGLFSRILGSRPAPAADRPAADRPAPAAAPPAAAPDSPMARLAAAAASPSRAALAPAEPAGPGLLAFFTEDHRACDRVWAEVESAPDGADTVAAWRRFDAALRRHLGWEEEVLFPALDDATGHHGFGPTEIMRGEHAQMRAVLDEMERCAETGDRGALLDQGDTLMMLIQQHNAKEEGMLYPMAEEALGARVWSTMAPRLR